MPPRIYLDHNATSPVRPEVRAAVQDLLFAGPTDPGFGNPSSVHWAGQAARRRLEQARARVAARFERRANEVVFTSGGTEADNLALFGTLLARGIAHPRLVLSAVEHPAVRAAATELRARGVDVEEIGVDPEGALDLAALEAALRTPTTLVSVMAVNNETGVALDVDAILGLAHAAGAALHVDAVQAIGRRPIDPRPDLLTVSGHKLGGLPGVGALMIRHARPLMSQLVGGPQERGHRAGTESVALATSLAEALELAETAREAEMARLSPLRDRIDAQLEALPGVRVLRGRRVGSVTCAVFEGVDGEALLQGLDLEGVAASSGSACSSGSLEPSHVLLAMGVPEALALSAVRFSLGWSTTEDDVDRLFEVLPAVLERARAV